MLFLLGLLLACQDDKLRQTEKVVSALHPSFDVVQPEVSFDFAHFTCILAAFSCQLSAISRNRTRRREFIAIITLRVTLSPSTSLRINSAKGLKLGGFFASLKMTTPIAVSLKTLLLIFC
jgi:hypothetical protein